MKFTTSNAQELTKVRALVHGDSGIGKTTSLGTLPPDRTLLAIGERGAIPLRGQSFNAVQLESWGDIRELIRMVQSATATEKGVLLEVGDKGLDVSVVGVDSLSELSELCKRQIVDVDRRILISERTKGKMETPAGVYDDQMTMEDWGLYRTRMTNMVSALCHLPVHIIVTCLSQWVEDKATGAQLRTININGKFAQECPAYFDEVLHMESAKDAEGQDIRVWRTFNDGRIIAKDASGVLAPFEETLEDRGGGWSHIIKKILNGKGK